MFWNKTLLKWKEPRFGQKYIAKQLRIKDYFLPLGKQAIKIFFGSYVIVWLLLWLSPKRNLHSIFDSGVLFIALMFVGGCFLIWLMTLAGSRLASPEVSLREKSFFYMSVEGSFSLPYKKMESFGIEKVSLDENIYFVLRFRDWDGKEGSVEIDPKIDNNSIIEILKGKNVQMKELY